MAPRFNAGPKLPAALRDQIDEQDRTNGRRSHSHLSRRDARKEQRQAKKDRKAQNSSQSHKPVPPPVSGIKRPAVPTHDEPVAKKRRLEHHDRNAPVAKKRTVRFAEDLHQPSPEKKKSTPLERLSSRLDSSQKPRSKRPTAASAFPKTQAEIEEDARIARYEKMLSQANDSDEDDGLDDLISFADKIVFSNVDVEEQLEDDENSENDEDFDEDEEGDEDEDDDVVIDEVELDEDDEPMESEDEDSDEFAGFSEAEEEGVEPTEEKLLDKEQAVTSASPLTKAPAASAYVPPHLRAKQAREEQGSESAEQIKLKRQVHGLLNRLTEQNIGSILSEIEALYRSYSRNDVTTALTNLVLETISSRSNLLDSFVILYSALIASLTKIVGIEFGASFVHSLITSYKHHYASLSTSAPVEGAEEEERGKECTNLIVLLSELYNFQVISSILLYDIIRDLLDGDLAEFNVELLLKLLKNSGAQLRHDDPKALNDIVAIVEQKTSHQEARALGSRTKFMLETLANLKSTKSKAVQNQAVATEATNRMKKFLGGLGKSHTIRLYEPLRVSLSDLLSSDQKGKWWLVGAAWAGDPLVDRKVNILEEKAITSESTLLKLAKKQGMNTDVRRKVFVVLLSSEDYVNAQEKLDQLNLTEVQQREIIRVLLHCCSTEKTYNPYYALVAQRLCQASHSHKVTLQFCLWDFLRELGETDVGGAEIVKSAREKEDVVEFDVTTTTTRIKNLAKAFAWLIGKGASNLMIFRPVSFTMLQPRTVTFLQTFLVYMILATQLRTPIVDTFSEISLPKKHNREALEQVIMKAAANGGLSKGLVYFVSKQAPATDKYSPSVSEVIDWGLAVMQDTLRTGMDLVTTLS